MPGQTWRDNGHKAPYARYQQDSAMALAEANDQAEQAPLAEKSVITSMGDAVGESPAASRFAAEPGVREDHQTLRALS